MHVQIPDRVTGAWISHFADDELKQVEGQIVLDIQEAEQRISRYEVQDPVNGSISFLDFGVHSKLSGRANTLRRRQDRVCAALVRASGAIHSSSPTNCGLGSVYPESNIESTQKSF